MVRQPVHEQAWKHAERSKGINLLDVTLVEVGTVGEG